MTALGTALLIHALEAAHDVAGERERAAIYRRDAERRALWSRVWHWVEVPLWGIVALLLTYDVSSVGWPVAVAFGASRLAAFPIMLNAGRHLCGSIYSWHYGLGSWPVATLKLSLAVGAWGWVIARSTTL